MKFDHDKAIHLFFHSIIILLLATQSNKATYKYLIPTLCYGGKRRQLTPAWMQNLQPHVKEHYCQPTSFEMEELHPVLDQ